MRRNMVWRPGSSLCSLVCMAERKNNQYFEDGSELKAIFNSFKSSEILLICFTKGSYVIRFPFKKKKVVERFWEDGALNISSFCGTHIPLSPFLSQAALGAGQTRGPAHAPLETWCWAFSQNPMESQQSAVHRRVTGLGVSVSVLPGPLEDEKSPVAWTGSCFCCWAREGSKS